jgi:KDO2-lipid IV(A) lauroyltransferase
MVRRAGLALEALRDAILGHLAVLVLRAVRRTDPDRMADFAGRFMQKVGPWLPEHRIGRANLAAAFPEKSPAEIETILAGVWDNLGRVAAEFAHLDRLRLPDFERPGETDITFDQQTINRFLAVRDSGRPTLLFASHLANWELPALVGTHFGLDTWVLYRPPSIRAISDAVVKIRAGCMGTLVASGFDAPIRLAGALQRGSHVGMLVDQYDIRGIDVTFFGRVCKVSPFLGQLARHFECPIRGTRIIRLPDRNSFRVELTEEIAPPRDAKGRIDVPGTMQAITTVIEGWVREHPEQWLWLHRRWR